MLNKLSSHLQIIRISPFDDTMSMMEEALRIIRIAEGVSKKNNQWDKAIVNWKL